MKNYNNRKDSTICLAGYPKALYRGIEVQGMMSYTGAGAKGESVLISG